MSAPAPNPECTITLTGPVGRDCFNKPIRPGMRVLIFARPYYGDSATVVEPGADDKGRVRVRLVKTPDLTLTFPGSDLEIILPAFTP